MAAPKQSVYTSPSDRDSSALSLPTDYDLEGGQGNVNADQGNDYNGTTPVSKSYPSLKGPASQSLRALKKLSDTYTY